uniref:Uncharacterized protein n=1 Tax=Anguilla anguilla TaxID=7936 RepID=A0A0E9QI32_ANGAN
MFHVPLSSGTDYISFAF